MATLLGWYISRDANFDGDFVDYYITFKKKSLNKALNRNMILSKENEKNIKKNRWKRNKLTIDLSKIMEIPRTNIEIGYIFLINDGCILHITQCISNNDIQDFKQNTDINKRDIITPKYISKTIFLINKIKINKLLFDHFNVDSNLFDVEWHSKYPRMYTNNNINVSNINIINKGGHTKITESMSDFHEIGSQSVNSNNKVFSENDIEECINLMMSLSDADSITNAIKENNIQNKEISDLIYKNLKKKDGGNIITRKDSFEKDTIEMISTNNT